MEKRERDLIMQELQRSIQDARNIDSYDEVVALEMFYEWFMEMFVY